MRVLTYSVSVFYCLLLISHSNIKSFVRAKSLSSGSTNYLQLSSDILNVKNLLEQELRNNNMRDINNHPQEVKNWPRRPIDKEITMLGQVSGVSVKANGNPVIFHRGAHTWDERTFDNNNQYNLFVRGPIDMPTILELDQKSGAVVKSWGENLFYMPHSITVDPEGNFWVTDVALHQAIKLKDGSNEPVMRIGEARHPGQDDEHFCKPTDVAVASNGDLFVSDGYCNSRIQKFNSEGKKIDTFGSPGQLDIPHAVTLLESRDMLCVADREHSRVLCYKAGLKEPGGGRLLLEVANKAMGPVYGITSHGSLLYAVTTPKVFDLFLPKVTQDGFTINADTGEIIDSWGPNMGFEIPHAVAASPDGKAVYVAQIGQAKVWKFIT